MPIPIDKLSFLATFISTILTFVIANLLLDYIRGWREGTESGQDETHNGSFWRKTIDIKMHVYKIIAILILSFVIAMVLGQYVGPLIIEPNPRVPDLAGLSSHTAEAMLEKAGLRAEFDHELNCSVERDYIVPGTQDPKPGTEILKNTSVRAKISLGGIPSVIGMDEEQAILILKESRLIPTVKYGRNSTVEEDQVFGQDHVGCEKINPGSEVNILIRKPLIADISSPLDNSDVISPVTIQATLSVKPDDNEFFWIVTQPIGNLSNYHPQTGGPLSYDPEDLSLTGAAYLGQGQKDIGSRHNVLVLLLNKELNEKFILYMQRANEAEKWPSITDRSSPLGVYISEEDIVRSTVGGVDNLRVTEYIRPR